MNRKGSAWIWILVLLIFLVIGLIVYVIIFDNNPISFGNSNNPSNTPDNNKLSNKDSSSGNNIFKEDTIYQPPALPE